MKGVIFTRVSSSGERQSTERQIKDLRQYAEHNSIDVVKEYSEHISGATKNDEREVLIECKQYCEQNEVEIICVSEMSRLSRSIYELQDTIKWAKDRHINIYFQKENISLYDKDGNESLLFPILVACLGFVAETERENIKFRLNSGRELAKKQGVKMGRPSGSKNKADRKEKYKEAIHMLKKGNSIRDVAKYCNVSVPTVQSIKKEFINNKSIVE
ncbi:MAG: recombinase family protein [Bacteroidales bacterium]|nr:recombinase family protein [Candidatus Physcousia equi]